MTLPDVDATTAVQMIHDREISITELVEAAISKIEMNDPKLNAVVVKDFNRAREAARIAEDRLTSGEGGRLLGLPITIKESFDVSGLPTSWGVTSMSGNVPASSAIAVRRLEDEGGIVLGKTNVPTFLDGLGSSNEVYGRTLSPLGAHLSPGGSSSGSAVAVRAGFSYLDIGSDLSGSIRHPASFCGLFGHSPSLGLVPQRGHSLFGRVAPFDMSTPGPIARSARDLALALDVISGPDDDLSPSLKGRLAFPRHEALRDYRVLVLDSHPLVPTDNEVSSAVVEFGRRLASAGAKVVDGASIVPPLDASTENYMRLLGAALSTGQDDATRAKLSALDAKLGRERDMRGNFLRGAVFSHSEWLDSQERRIGLRWQWKDVFRTYDAVICPAAPITGLAHEEVDAGAAKIDGVDVKNDDLIVWASVAKSADLPATVIPFATSRGGRPIGVQIIGPFMEDLTAIRLGVLASEGGLAPSYANVIAPPYGVV